MVGSAITHRSAVIQAVTYQQSAVHFHPRPWTSPGSGFTWSCRMRRYSEPCLSIHSQFIRLVRTRASCVSVIRHNHRYYTSKGLMRAPLYSAYIKHTVVTDYLRYLLYVEISPLYSSLTSTSVTSFMWHYSLYNRERKRSSKCTALI